MSRCAGVQPVFSMARFSRGLTAHGLSQGVSCHTVHGQLSRYSSRLSPLPVTPDSRPDWPTSTGHERSCGQRFLALTGLRVLPVCTPPSSTGGDGPVWLGNR